jgi:DNA-binding response OmpR family regulator
MLRNEMKDVLLAEDDHDDVEFFQLAMKEVSVPVDLRYAKNGDELFVELKKAIPHILFLDIQMPCKDGISCILEIRKNRKFDRLPVVMFSSLAHKAFVDKTYRFGANYYVVKPTSIAVLTERLQYLLSIEWEKQLYYPPREQFLLS